MFCVKAPPISGPMTWPTVDKAMPIPVKMGFWPSGAVDAMTVNAPFSIPAPPTPWTALPPINILDDVAEPQMADPTV